MFGFDFLKLSEGCLGRQFFPNPGFQLTFQQNLGSLTPVSQTGGAKGTAGRVQDVPFQTGEDKRRKSTWGGAQATSAVKTSL